MQSITYADSNIENQSYIIFDSNSYPQVVPLVATKEPIELPLGIFESNFHIQLSHALNRADSTVKVKISRSLTITGDGPHLDLTEYVRQESDWFELTQKNPHIWSFIRPKDISFKQAKEINIDEIKDYISKLLKKYSSDSKHWLIKAEECRPPFEKTCYWGESHITLKINSSNFNTEYELIVPLGC
jgi:hypothetical protein